LVSSGAPCPAFIHLHGGGFLNGSLDTETYICAATAVKLGIVVVHPEYRHTNKVSFPVPHDDVWDAFQWINAHCSDIGVDPADVVVGGQSAGSGLAASLVQREVIEARQQGRSSRIKGQVLTIPWLAHPRAFDKSSFLDESVMSATQCATAVGLSNEKLGWFASLLRAEDVFSDVLNPGLRRPPALDGVPKAAFLVAGGDPLRDQGLLYARHLEDAGSVNLLT
jgi:acetyl esterase/lipase